MKGHKRRVCMSESKHEKERIWRRKERLDIWVKPR
jgi:hypothetical protein